MCACVCVRGGLSGCMPASEYIKYYYQHYCSSLNNLTRRHGMAATRQANVEQTACEGLQTAGVYAVRWPTIKLRQNRLNNGAHQCFSFSFALFLFLFQCFSLSSRFASPKWLSNFVCACVLLIVCELCRKAHSSTQASLYCCYCCHFAGHFKAHLAFKRNFPLLRTSPAARLCAQPATMIFA